MSEWRIEYDNDTGPGDESFHEWWTVTDGSRHFRCNTESDANFLFDRLSEWKPIATAPKDGTRILVFAECNPAHRYFGSARVYVTEWVHVEHEPSHSNWEADALGFFPTHWQPLPNPPVTD